MEDCVTGFCFDKRSDNVLLIWKNRPEWQKGFLNGIGGKIELSESPYDAMCREFKEETGLEVDTWRGFCDVYNLTQNQRIYYYVGYGDIFSAKAQTDETLQIVGLDTIHRLKTVGNLKWLVAMALDPDINKAQIVESRPGETLSEVSDVREETP